MTEKEQMKNPTRTPDMRSQLSPLLDKNRMAIGAEDCYDVDGLMLRWMKDDAGVWHITRRGNARSWGDALTALGVECRLNVRGSTIECRVVSHGGWEPEGLSAMLAAPVGEWRVVTDVFERELQERHAELLAVVVWDKKKEARVAIPHELKPAQWGSERLLHLASHQHDAFAEYLKALPEWDGEDRLTGLLAKTLGAAQDDVVAQWVMHGLLVGAVARTWEPGAKHDWLPVLIGSQGIGKSYLLSSLLADETMHREMEMTNDHKLLIERTAGAVFCEWAELRQSRTTTLEGIKDSISRNKDVARLAYDRNTTHLPRRWVMAATANDVGRLGVLPPDDEHRRFLVVRCGVAALPLGNRVGPYIAAMRDQLWAQAQQEWEGWAKDKRGQPPNLPPEIAREHGIKAAEHAMRVPLWLRDKEHLLRSVYVLGAPQANATGSVSGWSASALVASLRSHDADGRQMGDTPSALAPQQENYAQQQLADMLRSLGWSQKMARIEGMQRRLWVAPDGWFDPEPELMEEIDESWME